MKALLVCGPSGSGKSTLVKRLIRQYPDTYIKAVQYTTRPRREGEAADEYKFVSPEEFEQVSKSLVGVTHINGNSYGSIMNPDEQRIQIFILNKDGIVDFQFLTAAISERHVKTLGVSRDFEKCCLARPSRSPEYIRSEFATFKFADKVFDNHYDELNAEAIADLNEVVQKMFEE